MSEKLPEAWSVRQETIGRERQPLVVIDNFVDDPRALIEGAAARKFAPIAPYYPGVRAAAPPAYLRPVAAPISAILKSVFGYANGAALQECFYSLATTPPSKLAPAQSIPHFDGVGDDKVAILHFLCEAGHGGTAFYRHRRTGFETVTSDRFDSYKRSVETDAAEHGMPKPDYFRHSNAMFERIASVKAAFNRAIIYRGVNLHAIDIAADYAFSANPRTGRLTVNSFVTPA